MWIVSFKKILFLKKNFYLKFTVCSVKRLFHKFPQVEKDNLYTFHWKGIQVAFSFVSKPNCPWCRMSKLWQQGGILDFTLEKSLPGRDFWNSWKYAFVESEPQFHITATIYKTEVGSILKSQWLKLWDNTKSGVQSMEKGDSFLSLLVSLSHIMLD